MRFMKVLLHFLATTVIGAGPLFAPEPIAPSAPS